MPNNYKYRAFISYSHADEKWAAWPVIAAVVSAIMQLMRASPGLHTAMSLIGDVFVHRHDPRL